MTKPTTLLLRDTEGNERLKALLPIAAKSFDVFEVHYLAPPLGGSRQGQVSSEAPSESWGVDNTLYCTPHVSSDASAEARFQLLPPKGGAISAIITSRHAANYYIKNQVTDSANFFVVGEETADIISQHGSGKVICVAKNAAELIEQIKNQRTHHELLYLRGRHVSLDIAKELKASGFDVREQQIYEVIQNEKEFKRLQQFVSMSNQPFIIPLLSKRTANVIAQYLFEQDFHKQQFHAVALSDVIMQSVSQFPWQSRHVAPESNLLSLASTCVKCHDGITQ